MAVCCTSSTRVSKSEWNTKGRWSRRRWESRKGHRYHRSTATSTLICSTACGTAGDTLHRYADDVILVCRQGATQALQAFESITRRMGLTLNGEKTRITKLTEGFDFVGFHFVKRRSPKTGKHGIYIFPSKTSQCNIRRQIKFFTKRRAPILPDEFVRQVNQAVLGWANYYRHTNASSAFRSLQHIT